MKELYRKFFNNILKPEENRGEEALSLMQSILLAWPFVMVEALTKFLLLYIFFDQFVSVQINQNNFNVLVNIISQNSMFSSFVTFFLSSFFEMLTFPLICYFSYLFWKIILDFFGWVLKIPKEEMSGVADNVVSASFSSYSFSIIPVIGSFVQWVAKGFILFQAIRKRLDISPMAALLIIFTPYILYIMAIVSFFIFIMTMFVSLFS
ncbi:MAG: hypothetical protein H6621_08645 [Halobacteriovoraceae bacterium]|nr:hypothetical protein [Halobacteriovoraceae bacterium]MCB9095121.1 hypothetical protein [Halobacteriovoraceae bacterium]